MKPFTKQASIANALTCSFILLLSLAACQQTKLVFTDTKPPVISKFTALKGAPDVSLEEGQHRAWNVKKISANLTLHQYPSSPSELVYLHLSLINPNRPFNNIDVLNTTLYQKAYRLAATANLSCIESLRINASMHSIGLQMACPNEEVAPALTLLAKTWQADAFDDLDLDTVRRQLKLNKHINAYSGGEIETVWAKKILGERHPYNLSLRNQALQDELTNEELVKLQAALLIGSTWHLLTSAKGGEHIDLVKNLALKLPDQTFSSNIDESSSNLKLNSQQNLNQHSQKRLYIIDAPGAVQTQVRVGYRLPITTSTFQKKADNEFNKSEPLTCQILASWLGRSFSGRLYYDLREQRGLTYGIYGRCFDNPLARTLKFYGSTQLQHSGAFISGILDHLALAKETKIKEAELLAIKVHEKSKYRLRSQSINSAFAYYIKHLAHGRVESESSQQKQISQLSIQALQHMAQDLFLTPPTILIRGDLDKIKKDLQQKLPHWQIIQIEP
ncbi:insulinase family protein [Shewanella sp. D64]|uniref:insulinase family protein n=1 Tax=unclassified Shewanella TaxID=196818 RepID=UPI0022BA19A2|nr:MULTISPECIES: insulinase family protein [unclassified Shewanella]MEC4728097.1 insulinase family protein [Shewanella sp. D64]MEC4738145.1 insulinase family protein [Shewanella sp. E94]WBJ96343.1 insulinase family protein [Shewanella sp. MTB7]